MGYSSAADECSRTRPSSRSNSGRVTNLTPVFRVSLSLFVIDVAIGNQARIRVRRLGYRTRFTTVHVLA